MENNEEEREPTIMEAFDIVWFKFVKWACETSKKHLSQETANLIESSIRRPSMLALITANSMLRKQPHTKDFPEWEEVEQRRKVVFDRDAETVKKEAMKLLCVTELTVPDEVIAKLFDYANVILELIDEMNENPK